MSKHTFDKKGTLRQHLYAVSAESLSAGTKLGLQGAILLYREGEGDHQFSLYVPSNKYNDALKALRGQSSVTFEGKVEHVWNGEDMEQRWRIDLPDAFGQPILDGIHKKQIAFAAARAVAPDQKYYDVLETTTQSLGRGGPGS